MSRIMRIGRGSRRLMFDYGSFGFIKNIEDHGDGVGKGYDRVWVWNGDGSMRGDGIKRFGALFFDGEKGLRREGRNLRCGRDRKSVDFCV